MSELLPCVRCGAAMMMHENDWSHPPTWLAYCTGEGCGILMPEKKTEKEAREAANYRPPSSQAARDMQDALHAVLFQVNQGKVLERDACVSQARRAYTASVVAGIVGQHVAAGRKDEV